MGQIHVQEWPFTVLIDGEYLQPCGIRPCEPRICGEATERGIID